MFASRIPPDRVPNRLARAVAAARRAGHPLLDLTLTNPTGAGIVYPPDLLQPLAAPDGLVYTPSPFGTRAAREAVACDYGRRRLAVDPSRVVLTSSTSEAYSLLFKLLCDPGDAVLVPAPSYPLFEHLTRLDGVEAVAYRLEYHGRWVLDVGSVDRAWSGRVRAVLGVTPNNPTGSLLAVDELAQLDARCRDGSAALVLDEVFADYPLQASRAGGADGPATALTFRLGGLSKSAGLPQVKLGWIAADGPAALVDDALERLELICDTYLSVSTPVQVAAPSLIERGATVRERILARVRQNHEELCRQASARPSIDVLPAEAGWSAVVRVPSTLGEEDLALELVERDAVVVHPGFFFDFAHEAFLVVSLLPEPAAFAEGVRRLMERADA